MVASIHTFTSSGATDWSMSSNSSTPFSSEDELMYRLLTDNSNPEAGDETLTSLDSPEDKTQVLRNFQVKRLFEAKKKKVHSLWKDFKGFINKGDVIQIAFGLAIGNAFMRLVNSLNDDIVLVPLGSLLTWNSFKCTHFQPFFKLNKWVRDFRDSKNNSRHVLSLTSSENWFTVIRGVNGTTDYKTLAAAKTAGAITLNYGIIIQICAVILSE